MLPYYTERQPNHMYTVDNNFGYRSKKFICTCTKSSAHALGTEIRGGNFKHFKTCVGCIRYSPLVAVRRTHDKTFKTLTHLMLPYYTERQPNHMYTVDNNFGYRSKKFICTCTKSSAHALGTEIRGGNFKHFKTCVGCIR